MSKPPTASFKVLKLLLKLRKGKYNGSMKEPRWGPETERVSFSFPHVLKTYTNPWEGQNQVIPNQ
jgi:hypothetical protein